MNDPAARGASPTRRTGVWLLTLGLAAALGVGFAQEAPSPTPPPTPASAPRPAPSSTPAEGPEPAASEAPVESARPTNRLAHEQSPYLRQHAHNPVDWYPWGPEAFAKAKREGKLVFLSIGYATCHWCHVMERESFEDKTIAAYLNQHYVAIKVDREERPDVDEVYMTAIQHATGSGGWPLSVWLTPSAEPLPDVAQFEESWGSSLTGGTYFPTPARFGRRTFLDELKVRAELWAEHRAALTEDAAAWTRGLAQALSQQAAPVELDKRALTRGVAALAEVHDPVHGGFGGGSPTRFPMPHTIGFLLRQTARGHPEALPMVTATLDAICSRGLRDHLGGGFHRYSTDPHWKIPHFEKMLYDQAGLTRALVEAHLLTGRADYAAVARETVEFVLAEMRTPGGAFTSAWDADSEGEEGRFYVWSAAELREVLGADYALFAARYSVSDAGNFHELHRAGQAPEPLNHLQLAPGSLEDLARAHGLEPRAADERLSAARAKLLARRRGRTPPLHDDKVLTDWNGLMIGATALAGRALGEPRYTAAAVQAAEFLLRELRRDGQLYHRWRGGEAKVTGLLDDYAFLAGGLLDLYEATYEPRWLREAEVLLQGLLARFWDPDAKGFFQVEAGSGLIARPKPTYDGAIPSGNAAAALALLRLGALSGDDELWRRGEETLASCSAFLAAYGGPAGALGLTALDLKLGPRREVVVAGDPSDPRTRALLRVVEGRFLPRTFTLLRPLGPAAELVAEVPWVAPMTPKGGDPAAFVCTNFACQAPVSSPAALAPLLAPAHIQAPGEGGK